MTQRIGKGRNVRGDIQPATSAGFAALIERADEYHEQGFVLAGVVNLGPGGKALGGVFVKMPKPPAASLVGE